MPRRKRHETPSTEQLKTQILAVKLRAEQVKLRIAEWKAPAYIIGSFTPLPDDTLVHLRVPPELDIENNIYHRKQLDYARRIGLATPVEQTDETQTAPERAPVTVSEASLHVEASDPEYEALMERARKAVADYHAGQGRLEKT